MRKSNQYKLFISLFCHIIYVYFIRLRKHIRKYRIEYLKYLSLGMILLPIFLKRHYISYWISIIGWGLLTVILIGDKEERVTNFKLIRYELLTMFLITYVIDVLQKTPKASNEIFNISFFILSSIFSLTIIYKIYQFVEKKLANIFSLLFHFIIVIFIVIHIFAILYMNPWSDNYIMYNDIAHTCQYTCDENYDVYLGDKIDFYYFSGVVLTTLGFGDYIPIGNYMRFFVILEAIIGMFILVTFLAKAIDILAKKEK